MLQERAAETQRHMLFLELMEHLMRMSLRSITCTHGERRTGPDFEQRLFCGADHQFIIVPKCIVFNHHLWNFWLEILHSTPLSNVCNCLAKRVAVFADHYSPMVAIYIVGSSRPLPSRQPR